MPPTATILAVGDELILGQSLDTNTRFIADALTGAGFAVIEHATVPDDLPHLAETLTRLAHWCDLLVVTGGLGPTSDDLTRAALAAALGDELVEDPDALEEIRSWFAGRGRAMPDANRVQAMRPTAARMLGNDNGTAPGLAAELDRCRVFCLPGPPSEMKPMLERFVLADADAPPVTVRTLYTIGLGESAVAMALAELMDRDRPVLVGTTASLGVVTVRIRAADPSAADTIDQVLAEARARIGPAAFSDRLDLPAHCLESLRIRGDSVGTVESCTGGLLAEMLTQVPGSSDAFMGGLVTYTNRLKHNLTDVPEQVFATVGAVSAECATAMAEGGRRTLGTDHALAVTGIAGPGGGTDTKPVGTVYIALASRGSPTDTRLFHFRGGRDAIRKWSATSALAMLRLRLDGVEMELLGERH